MSGRWVQDNITRFWSMVAPDYEAHGGNVPAPDGAEHHAWVEAIRAWLPPAPADVLDIGTGTGFVALIAAGLGHRVTGIDLAEPMLEQARAAANTRGVSATFLLGDAVNPEFPQGSFDAVICRHFLWTLREPDAALRNWRSLLRPGGRVVAIDGFWFAAEEPSAGVGPFEQHYTGETRAALPAMAFDSTAPVVQLFERTGFDSVTVETLDEIHRLAEAPPSEQPWYVVIAAKGRDAG